MILDTKIKIVEKFFWNEKIMFDYVDFYYWKNLTFLELKNKWKYYINNIYKEEDGIKFYIHIPFCIKKCHFCMYNTKIINKLEWNKDIDEYLDYLISYYEYFKSVFLDIKFNWLYIWWWTPSVLNNKQLEKFLSYINKNIKFKDNFFKTIELNPYTTTLEKLNIIKNNWINRISFWVQSFKKEILDIENREYASPEYIKKLVDYSKKIWIKNINLDIIVWLKWDNENNILDTLLYLKDIKSTEVNIYIILKNKEKSKFYNVSWKNHFFKNINKIMLWLIKKSWILNIYNLSYESFFIWASLRLKTYNNDYKYYECHSKDKSSLFSIWTKSFSKIYWVWYYNNSYKNQSIWDSTVLKNFKFLDEKLEIYSYLLKWFQKEISKIDFKNKFNKDIYDLFWIELDYLKKNNIIKENKEKIYYTWDIDFIWKYWLLFLDLKTLLKYSKYFIDLKKDEKK